ncbi:UDP-N-acetylmuramoyl-L-alanine--D-glutamate ligase [Pseudonocardia asaccharolytica]|uniref:UDP-N-acetylmuramoylalanine--D-glutamate ligase n=1 Tax=Pseudonocardia asaccharolytica DSM 44247 = NBRC 16224 TaxID=1123024 RepID=A0A511D843_9PSEU|nr:UDP-N-acetylmuramoyl-L-alanine--D-glutamate ligase [Pseudonocardia asaccharolytica]GEL20787.1 UDP-N-acetylmuramoylalanine--D-glutamate ligase [Pseudonocardia asaccharolytica DSM 44247 = NBRC 16224]
MSAFTGRRVLVAGAGISGVAAAEVLLAHGALVTVTDDDPARLAGLPAGTEAATGGIPEGTALIVTSPGRRPGHPLVAQAAERGIELVGEPELAWRIGAAAAEPPAWLVVTGTNGKTTTTGMLAAILQAAGLDAVACGNIGDPVISAVAEGHRVLAVELSSFQLHWSPSVRPVAGCVLNVAQDHLDWHGGMDAYAAAKARALTGDVAVAVVDDVAAAGLLAAAPAPRRVEVTLGEPGPGQLGVAGGTLCDRAFAEAPVPLVDADQVTPGGAPGLADALAAAALARAYGVGAEAVAAGLAGFRPGPHRAETVGTVGGVRYVDDSKATNPHAADASLSAQEGSRVVWIAGGLLKGASVAELIARRAPALAGVVVIGIDRVEIVGALARHAPHVPVAEVGTGEDDPMTTAVRRAAALARPGDVVLLAPAAASMDQFRDYAHRGDAFRAAVRALATPGPAGTRG